MGNGTKAKRLNQPEVLLPMSALGLQQGGYCSQSVEFTGKPKESKKAPWMCVVRYSLPPRMFITRLPLSMVQPRSSWAAVTESTVLRPMHTLGHRPAQGVQCSLQDRTETGRDQSLTYTRHRHNTQIERGGAHPHTPGGAHTHTPGGGGS